MLADLAAGSSQATAGRVHTAGKCSWLSTPMVFELNVGPTAYCTDFCSDPIVLLQLLLCLLVQHSSGA
jgi:hypothetical protein